MTAKTIEDFFLADDLRTIKSCEDLSREVRYARTHEEVEAIRTRLQWLVDFVDDQ